MDDLLGFVSIITFLNYIIAVFINITIASKFTGFTKEKHNLLWLKWGAPKTVFMPDKKLLGMYKFIWAIKKNDNKANNKLYYLSKSLLYITIWTQFSFAMVAFTILFGRFIFN